MYGISNSVQPFIRNSVYSAAKPASGRKTTGGFVSQFQSAAAKRNSDSVALADRDAALTEAGKSSTGDKQLTPSERQALIDQYD